MKTPERQFLFIIFLFLLLAFAPSDGGRAAVVAQKNPVGLPATEADGSFQSPSVEADRPEGLIHLDVIVTNQAGKPVSGLKAADLVLLDKGQPQKIIPFEGTGARTDPPVAITLVIDTLQPDGAATQQRKSVEAFLKQNGGHLTLPVSVLLLTDAGLLRIGPPSTDGNALAESIAHSRATSWNRRNLATLEDEVWEASQAQPIGEAFSFATGTDPAAETALKALGVIAASERRTPGRKLLIWIGPGWGLGSGKNPAEKDQTEYDKQVLFDKIVWFSNLLRLARVNLYSFSVGEETNIPGSPPNSPPTVSSPEQASTVDLNRKMLAMESGGRALKPSEDSRDIVRQIGYCIREATSFYTLTFNPARADHSDEYHDLKVNVRQPGQTARTNTGYYDQPYFSDAPDAAIRKVSVAQLEQLLRAERGASDGDIARQFSGLELTEQANEDQIASWAAELHGKKRRQMRCSRWRTHRRSSILLGRIFPVIRRLISIHRGRSSGERRAI